jgi:reactive intermediate/imine deaminase
MNRLRRRIGGTWVLGSAACLGVFGPPGTLGAQVEVEYLRSETTRARGLPFSDAVKVGNMLYLSGQIGVLPADEGASTEDLALVPGGIGPETRQTMENIESVLEANGSSLDRVVKCLIMLADIAEWPAMNEVYVTFFGDHFPARSAFAGTGLALGARVEIECWAIVEPDRPGGG